MAYEPRIDLPAAAAMRDSHVCRVIKISYFAKLCDIIYEIRVIRPTMRSNIEGAFCLSITSQSSLHRPACGLSGLGSIQGPSVEMKQVRRDIIGFCAYSIERGYNVGIYTHTR